MKMGKCCRRCARLGIVIMVFTFVLPKMTKSQTLTWTWTSPKFAACEGIGIAGSFRVTADAGVKALPNGDRLISSLAVSASSAAFTQGHPSIGVKASVLKGTQTTQEARLTEAKPPAITKQPASDESKGKYLPPTVTLLVPKGGRVRLSVTATITTNGGDCVLGSTEKEFDPFATP